MKIRALFVALSLACVGNAHAMDWVVAATRTSRGPICTMQAGSLIFTAHATHRDRIAATLMRPPGELNDLRRHNWPLYVDDQEFLMRGDHINERAGIISGVVVQRSTEITRLMSALERATRVAVHLPSGETISLILDNGQEAVRDMLGCMRGDRRV